MRVSESGWTRYGPAMYSRMRAALLAAGSRSPAKMRWTAAAMRKKLTQGAKVGLFSALGFVLGMATKIALGLVMSGLVLTSVVCAPPA